MSDLYGSDAYSLVEIARRIESVGEAKARMAALPLALLGAVRWRGICRAPAACCILNVAMPCSPSASSACACRRGGTRSGWRSATSPGWGR